MPTKDIVVVGSSAGGVGALQRLCRALPADFPGSVLIAQHLSASARSMMPELLKRAAALPVTCPADGDPLEPGHIYIGAPDQHILVRPGKVLMRRGPHENRSRPSCDALFRSAAVAYGSRVIGVVLTGLLDDGTEGLNVIRAAGGTSVVQDPADAEWSSMPEAAIRRDHVNHVAPLSDIPKLLDRLVREAAEPDIPLPEEYILEDRIAAQEFAVIQTDIVTPGHPSRISCPDCGGVLNQLEADEELRFRCQVGHAFTQQGLVAAQNDELERALAVAARTHRDRVRLFNQMRERAQARGLSHALFRWEEAARESTELARLIDDAIRALRRPVP